MIKVDLDTLYYTKYYWSVFQANRPAQDNNSALKVWLRDVVCRDEIYLWCKENLSGDWDFTIENGSLIEFYINPFYFEFELEEDATAFKLRWM